MICPKCKTPIAKTLPQGIKDKAIALYKQGYSNRQIEKSLHGALTHVTASRIIKSYKTKGARGKHVVGKNR